MTRKIIWYLVSSLLVLSLVLVSCSEVDTEEEEIVSSDVPKYGGVLTIGANQEPSTFDDAAIGNPSSAYTLMQTNDMLIIGDWTKGSAGTGEADWSFTSVRKWEIHTGCLAESWEMPEYGHIIFHIRRGVHFSLDPDNEASRLVNGRELTAGDVATSLNEIISNPKANLGFCDSKHAIITAPDKWTVDMKLPEEYFTWATILAGSAYIKPPEVREKYGDMAAWENSVGTGPFILKEYVVGSSVTLARNDNYWDVDPIGPGKGNQLPYLDGIKFLIITDTSTRLAALRTATIDVLHNVAREDADSLKETNSDIMSKKLYRGAGKAINMRIDKMDLPFNDKNVRRALMMATDFETINRDYYGGEAQILSWPILDTKEYHDAYLGLEDPEMPESVKELYVYNPTKAKELLADAGYPTGFTATILCNSIPEYVDYVSIIKDMWSKVDVELVIDAKEPGAYFGLYMSMNYDEMLLGGPMVVGSAFQAYNYAGANIGGNHSHVDDPLANEVKEEMGRLEAIDIDECARVHKEFMKYALDQAWSIPAPTPPAYHLWWPWLKNYHGEYSVGVEGSYIYPRWVWIDQDLKKEMTD
ncbi:ABC transporter substrate-binding protein [Chloroflexota bacterium]